MHPSHHARTRPDRAAYVMAASGETVSWRELDDRSNQGAQLFRTMGLEAEAPIAILLENHPRYYEVLWAAQRSGLRFTCLSSKLSVGEVAYILADSEARLLITSDALAEVALAAAADRPGLRMLTVDAPSERLESFRALRDAQPAEPIPDEQQGTAMLYSSGTTGRPKGVRRAAVDGPQPIDAPSPLATLGTALYGFDPDMVFLSPAPLYHAAPLAWSMAVQSLGGTVVLMERFDAELALEYIARYRVTHAQFVPTHFVRMLKLPEAARARHDLSSLRAVFHAAAPCPVPVKRAMLDWWGPIVHEYYAGTEGNGFTAASAAEWLERPGTVGRGVTAEVRICDEHGDPVPPRTEGGVYFAGGGQFEYHNDPAKTADSHNKHGWSTLGDIGWLDEEGYLYLTDRKSFMIISGGVNIYPAEIENLLVTHPKVADVAVVGAPHEEMGEQVVAVVQPLDWSDAGEALAAELTAFARAGLSHVKAPRRIDFMAELPRHATGKLYKRLLRDGYWAKESASA